MLARGLCVLDKMYVYICGAAPLSLLHPGWFLPPYLRFILHIYGNVIRLETLGGHLLCVPFWFSQ